MDPITIDYAIDESTGGAQCKGTTTYQGENIIAFGNSWQDATVNVVNKAKAIKKLLPVPDPKIVDLDPVVGTP